MSTTYFNLPQNINSSWPITLDEGLICQTATNEAEIKADCARIQADNDTHVSDARLLNQTGGRALLYLCLLLQVDIQ